MSMTENGVSTTRTPSQEQYEKFTTGRGRQRKVRVQYDYRDLDDQLFSCVASTLEAARAKRDAWLEQKKAA